MLSSFRTRRYSFLFTALFVLFVGAMVVVPLVTHSLISILYTVLCFAACTEFIIGASNIEAGMKTLRSANNGGQRLAWYRQNNLTLGMLSLLVGVEMLLLAVMFSTNINVLMAAVAFVSMAITLIAELFFGTLTMKYRQQPKQASV